jgi:ABC-type enterochelin transport system ATPase subunit
MRSHIISINEAAKLVGRSPKTLYAAIKTGKLSAITGLDGKKTVSVSEIVRVYEVTPRDSNETSIESDKLIDVEVLELRHKLDLLAQENEHLKQRLDDKEKNLEDLREATKLLTGDRKQTSWIARFLK